VDFGRPDPAETKRNLDRVKSEKASKQKPFLEYRPTPAAKDSPDPRAFPTLSGETNESFWAWADQARLAEVLRGAFPGFLARGRRTHPTMIGRVEQDLREPLSFFALPLHL